MTPNDFGPIYRETNMAGFPVEPWNTASNLIFLFTFFYWAYRIRHSFKEQYMVAISLPILFIGWVGGTIYHATRSHNLWLYMDFLPIYILGFMLAFYFWYKLTGNVLRIFILTIIPYFLLNFATVYIDMSQNVRASTGYFLIFVMAAYPVIKYALNNKSKVNTNLVYAVICFALAITARIGDQSFPETFLTLFPQGTHWLWHTIGGLTTFFMFKFVFEDRQRELSAITS
jgi:hemolysin III